MLGDAEARSTAFDGGTFGAVTHDKEACARVRGMDSCEGVEENFDAMPGFEGADEADGAEVRRGESGRDAWVEAVGVHAVGNNVYGRASGFSSADVLSDALRNGEDAGGGAEGAARGVGRAGGVVQRAKRGLLLHKWGVDFEHAGHAHRASGLHGGVAPEGVAFVEEVALTGFENGGSRRVVRVPK